MYFFFLPVSKLFLFVILVLPMTGCVSRSSITPVSQTLTSYAESLLHEINIYRHSHALQPLQLTAQLTGLAWQHSDYMSRTNRMSHSGFTNRYHSSGSRHCVENIGWNYRSPFQQFAAWRTSDVHDNNLLNPDIEFAGIAEINRYVTFLACH